MTATALERFLDKIALDDENGACWIWLGAKDSAGYPRLHVTMVRGDRNAAHAHRWAYERWIGPIPKGFEIHHVCEVPACVNPDHLQALTRREHTLDVGHRNVAALNARKTHCKRGHEFTETNTYWFNDGRWRSCKACRELASNQRDRQVAPRSAT